MGSSNGLYQIDPHPPFGTLSSYISTDLICFQINNDVYPTGSPCDIFAGTNSLNSEIPIQVFQNPVTNNLEVRLPENKTNLVFEIIDVNVKTVYRKNLYHSESINDFNHSGIFLWKISEQGKTVSSGKVFLK